MQANLDDDAKPDTEEMVQTEDASTLDFFLVRAAFFQKRFVEQFGSQAYYNMIRKAYLTQPLEEWPSSP